MDTPRQPSVLPARPASGRWWLSLLTAALFVCHVNYVRIHLLTELHHGGSSTASAQAEKLHDHHHDGEDHEHSHDQHKPHSASEHQIQLAGKKQCPLVAFALLLPETSILLTLPEPLVVYSTFELGSRPGESPPDPRQPRAPPSV